MLRGDNQLSSCHILKPDWGRWNPTNTLPKSDPSDLNKFIKREHHPVHTVEKVAASIPDAKVFSQCLM